MCSQIYLYLHGTRSGCLIPECFHWLVWLHRFAVLWFSCSDDIVWATSLVCLNHNFWMNHRCSGRQPMRMLKACHARTPTKVFEVCPNDSSSGTSSTRQATVESEFLSGIGGPLFDAKLVSCLKILAVSKESRGAGTPSCASPRPARWQRGGQRKPATNTGHYLFRSSHG